MTEEKRFSEAMIIKIAAVATALPRWAGALMVSEGVPMPAGWLELWRWLVLALSFGMAIVEAFGISYMLHRARTQGDRKSRWLVPLVVLNLAVFAVLVAPYAYANMRNISVSQALPGKALGWLWAVAVPVSTGALVAGVGFSDKSKAGARVSTGMSTSPNGNVYESLSRDEYIDLIRDNSTLSQAQFTEKYGLPKSTYYKYRQVALSTESLQRQGVDN
jgi:hypothetical protein